MNIEYILIFAIIVIAAILLYVGFIHLIKNKNLNHTQTHSSLDIDMLVQALGGQTNIREVRNTASKVTVVLTDFKQTHIEDIKSLGASGIVEGQESLSMIFGKQSENIAKDLKDYLHL